MGKILKKRCAVLLALVLAFSTFLIPLLNPVTVSAAETGVVHFYVSIDGTWKKVNDASFAIIYNSKARIPGTLKWTYFVTASQLEEIYGQYGFKASDLKAGSETAGLFRHSKPDEDRIWADRQPFNYYSNGVCLQLRTDSPDCDVFYLPNDASSTDAYKYRSDQALAKANSVNTGSSGSGDQTTGTVSSATGNINFYVSMNDAWEKVGGEAQQVSVIKTRLSGKDYDTYAISTKELEKIYGTYGFEAGHVYSNVNLTVFRHAERGNSSIWCDRYPFTYNGETYVQLLTYTPDCDLYYLPNDGASLEATKSAKDTSLARANSYYKISIDNGSTTTESYVLRGSYIDVALPTAVEWTSDQGEMTEIGTLLSTQNGYATYRINGEKSIHITVKNGGGTSGDSDVTYVENATGNINFYVSMNDTWEKVGGEAQQVSVIKTRLSGKDYDTYAISTKELEKIYGTYGFEAGHVYGNVNLTVFRHAEKGNSSIWCDRYPFTYNGETYVQLLTYTPDGDLYYLPNDGASLEATKSAKDTSLARANSFYRITINNGTTTTESYVLRDSYIDVSLPVAAEWTSDQGEMTEIGTLISTQNGYATYRITGNKSINITIKNSGNVSGDDDVTSVEEASGNVNFYVCINEEWTKVDNETKNVSMIRVTVDGRTTYAISENVLADVYGTYNFKTGMMYDNVNTTIFRHTGRDNNTIWGDRAPFVYNGTTYIQVLESDTDCDVYYLPNDGASYDERKYVNDAALAKANTFYTIDIEANTEIGLSANRFYTLTGYAQQVTLPIADGYTWESEQLGTEIGTILQQNDGGITYSITVDQPIVLRAVKDSVVDPVEPTDPTDPTDPVVTDETAEINFYVSLNDTWAAVGGATQTVPVRKLQTSAGEVYAISASELLKQYEAYGFRKAALTEGAASLFRTTERAGTISEYITAPFTHEGETYLALSRTNGNCDVYYLPDTDNTGTSAMDLSDGSLISNNTRYTITVRGNEQIQMTETVFYKTRQSTLYLYLPKLPDGLSWSSEQMGTEFGTIVRDSDGTLMYSITANTELVIEPKVN